MCRRPKLQTATYREVLGLIQGIIPFDAASIFLRESDSGRYVLAAALQEEVSLPEMLVVRDEVQAERWRPVVHRPLVWLPDEADIRAADSSPAFAAILIVPLFIDSESIGLLNLASYTDGVLSEKQIRLASVIADQLAVSVERMEYVSRIEAQHRDLQNSHEQLRAHQARIVADEKLTAIAQLAASINHQINNPLSVIVGNVQCLVLEERALGTKAQARLRRIVDAALKVGEVNRRLLNIQTLAVGSDPKGSEVGPVAETVS